MTQRPDPPADTLVVPIELSALPVGDGGQKVADLAVRFDIQNHADLAWLGQNAEPLPFTRSSALRRGVHLHWRLPAALSRSRVGYRVDAGLLRQLETSSGLRHHARELTTAIGRLSAPTRPRLALGIETILKDAGVAAADALDMAGRLSATAAGCNQFPAVPNRWRVSRWLGAPGASAPKSWVIESDRLWEADRAPQDACAAQNDLSPSVLHLPRDRTSLTRGQPLLHRRLGLVSPGDAWRETAAPADRLAPFTALGYGHPMFAAALPHCYNVFGLWDPLEDAGEDADVSYVVVGWYGDPGCDPAAQAADFDWTWSGDSVPARTVLRGELAGIAWKRDATPRPRPNPVAVAIGNTTAEALSAAIARLDAFRGKSGLERYLNVLQLGLVNRLHDRHPGGLKQWDMALHRHDFAAVQGGTRWVLRPRERASGVDAVPLPGALGGLLADLNDAQEALDRSQRALAAQRDQLFADWANHLAVNPAQALSALEAGKRGGWRNIGRARLAAGVEAVSMAAADMAQASLRRDAAQRALVEDLGAWSHGAGYLLQGAAAPRYWQPTDPVVLVWGKDARPAPPWAAECRVTSTADAEAPALSSLAKSPEPDPWRALMIAWEASYQADHPLEHGAGYPPRYLADGFRLDPRDTNDLSAPDGSPALPPKRFSGMAPLTAAPTINLAAQAQRYVDSYPAAADDAAQQRIEAELLESAERLKSAPIQSQALGGFNEALLGRRQSLEFPVLDPHAASASEFEFGLRVGRAVADGNARGCVPEGMFNPLRCGHLTLHRLWLIDGFGRVLPVVGEPGRDRDADLPTPALTPEQVIRSERLAPLRDADGRCALRPRLIAPARLAFRWRSASDHRADADHDPANSPVVGWVLADHLDNRLAIYGPGGDAVGSLNMDGALWRGAPGPRYRLRPERALPEGPLRQTILGLIAAIESSGSRDYLQSLLDAVDDMTQHILPNRHAQHPGLSVLIGRPLAIVRASLDLDLAVPPPVDQRIEAFTAPPEERPRNAGGLAELLVPVKLGHRAHLDDGLVGYFVGPSDDPATYQAFYVEQFSGDATPRVRHPAADQIAVSAAGDPVLVTMLMDPRSPIHATTGILPAKAIDLPAALYAPALSRMSVSFPVGPIIAPRDPAVAMPVPTPEEPGYQWQFLHPTRDGWASLPVGPAAAPAAALLHTQDIFEGWLQLQPVPAQDKPGDT